MKPAYVTLPGMRVLNDLEKKFGKGPTYSHFEIREMLDHKIPEQLYRGRRFLRGHVAESCSKAIDYLLEGRSREKAQSRIDELIREVEARF